MSRVAIDRVLAEAAHHYGAGRLEVADQICSDILRTAPDHVDALHLSALIAFVSDRAADGAALLRRVFSLSPNHAQAFATLGDALANQGEHDGAAAAFQRAAALRPADAVLRRKLAIALRELGHLEAAAAASREAIELDAHSARAFFILAQVLTDQGKLDQAEAAYRAAIGRDPTAHDAWLNLGNVLADLKRDEESIAAYRRAVALAPDFADGYRNLALALNRGKRPVEALQACQHALTLQPDRTEAHLLLSKLLLDLDRGDDAIAACRHALTLVPDNAALLNNLGAALYRQGQLQEAISVYRQAAALAPDDVEPLKLMGLVLHETGRHDEALQTYRRVSLHTPDDPVVLSNIAACLYGMGRFDEAEAACRLALAAKPDYSPALTNLGIVFEARQDFAAAEATLRKAVAADPSYAKAHANLAVTLRARGQLDEAFAVSARALDIDPDDALSNFNHAHLLLMNGEFVDGFRQYEWRFKCRDLSLNDHHIAGPEWQGDGLAGRTLLLQAEQGLGDTLQFVRYIPMIAATGGAVLLQAQPELCRLLRNTLGIPVFARGEAPPPFDVQLPLMSIPRVLGTTADTIVADVPYLDPEPAKLAAWQHVLRDASKMKVGVVWAGNPRHKHDVFRSLAAEAVLPRLAVPGVQLYSLQKDPRPADHAVLADLGDAVIDLETMLRDFSDTAAAICALDLVITIDSAVAHLAGALGRPVWLMLPYALDWRWLREREDSPWYPTMRLFRQSSPGDWDSVLSRLPVELERVQTGQHERLWPRPQIMHSIPIRWT